MLRERSKKAEVPSTCHLLAVWMNNLLISYIVCYIDAKSDACISVLWCRLGTLKSFICEGCLTHMLYGNDKLSQR